MEKKKSKMGRPPKPESEKRSEHITVRLTREEYRIIKAEAKRTGQTYSEILMQPWREK